MEEEKVEENQELEEQRLKNGKRIEEQAESWGATAIRNRMEDDRKLWKMKKDEE